ncbi:MAG: methyltransferase domain-containing protein [bacterium]
MVKLHIGCGDVYLDGWVNIDSESGSADLTHDMREPLPYDDNSVDFIYNEHFIEHVGFEDGLKVMTDFHRVLKPGGVVRVATLDLDYVMKKYFFLWKRQDWIKRYGHQWIKTRAEMMNVVFRHWGHQYLYNGEELERRLRESGFEAVYRRRRNRSRYPELRNLETRRDSKLVMEAEKRGGGGLDR